MKFWFKGFKKYTNWTEFALKKITVLTGENNSGKSSITQLLNVLQKSFSQNPLPNLVLNTESYKLGTENSFFNYEDKKGQFQIVFQNENKSFILFNYEKKSKNSNEPYVYLKDVRFYLYKIEIITPIISIELDDYNRKIKFDEQQLVYYLNQNKSQINDFYNQIYQQEYEALEEKKRDEILELEKKLQDHIDAGGSKEDEDSKEVLNEIDNLKQKSFTKRESRIKIKVYETYSKIVNELIEKTSEITDFFEIENFDTSLLDQLLIEQKEEDRDEKGKDHQKDKRPDYISYLEQELKKTKSKYSNYFSSEAEIIYSLIEQFSENIKSVRKIITGKNFNYSSSIMKFRKRAFSEYDANIKYIKKVYDYSNDVKEKIDKRIMKLLTDKLKLQFNKVTIDVKIFEGIFYQLLINDKNMADYGDGFKNIIGILLPILVEEIEAEEQQNFIIEEPEIRLHPKTQSLLADIFVELAKEHEFIIETHSEYLIRQFQYRVLNDEIKSEDVLIYYIKENGKIDMLKIGKNGILEGEFGPGFIDEAGRIIYKILKKQKEQKLKDING